MNHQGTVVRYIDELAHTGRLKDSDIANVTGVPKATVSRWRSGAARPHPKNELILSDLYYVVGRLREYYAGDEIRTWLYARHPQLGGARAVDLIHEGQSIAVLRALDRIDAGIHL